MLFNNVFLENEVLLSGETIFLAPKEQPPRKLSGKRTDEGITLWKEIKFRRRSKTLRQKYRWGHESAMQEKYINIKSLRVSSDLVQFVKDELLIETNISPENFWAGFEKTVNELAPKNRELINIRKDLQNKIFWVSVKLTHSIRHYESYFIS